MTPDKVHEILKAKHAQAVSAFDPNPKHPSIKIAPEFWRVVAKTLRDDCGLDYLVSLTAVDRAAELEAIYTLEVMDGARCPIHVRVLVPRDNPLIATVEDIWRTADWHEREAWDLMGITFVGHHNLVRILCAEDWEGHPLRKDYKSPDTYHGIKNNVT